MQADAWYCCLFVVVCEVLYWLLQRDNHEEVHMKSGLIQLGCALTLMAVGATTSYAQMTLKDFEQDMETVGSARDHWGTVDIRGFELDGPVTEKDIALFRGQYEEFKDSRPTINKKNRLGVAKEGTRLVIAFAEMYKLTGDPFYIDRMVEYVDSILMHRNDVRKKYLATTGSYEAFWPNFQGADKESDPKDIRVRINAFSSGVVVGRISYAAKLILETESLHDEKVKGGDPFGFGETYLDRANYYLDQVSYVLDSFYMKHWYDAKSGRLVYPKNKALIPEKVHKRAGVAPAWNRYFMMTMGFARAAEALERRGNADDAERIKLYDNVVQVSVDEFFGTMKRKKLANGKKVYWWPYDYYYKPVSHRAEETGHGGLDMNCLYPIYVTGRYGITKEQMEPFVNVVRDVLYDKKSGKFYSSVEGAAGEKAKAKKSILGSGYMRLSVIDPSLTEFILDGWKKDKRITTKGLKTGMYAELLQWKNHLYESGQNAN
ncbi:hypothetical protein JD969_14160 [Planctomycetota bacterium]|nr:hypothetical protein JD969_14160 [Planctomycetota bacterium]